MKSFSFVSAILTAAVVGAVTIVPVQDLPQCALFCLQTEISQSPCGSLTNITCQCTNRPLADAITTCVRANCTIRETLTTMAYNENSCGAPVRNDTQAVVIAAMVGMSLAFVAFVLRMISRYIGAGGTFWWDDAVMFVVMGLAIPLSAFSVVLSKHGLGRDIWTVSFDDITAICWYYMWDEFMYLTALPLIKISVLCFYLRIFSDEKFRYMVFVAMSLCLGYGTAFLIVTIWQCNPIEGAWTHWDGAFKGHCSDLNLQGWTSAVFNILLDLIIIGLPLPQLIKMKMSTRNKVPVILMFCLGFFITIVSIIRLTSLIEFGGSSNLTWDYVSVGYWSTIEIHLGIICACLPPIRALFKRMFPNLNVTQERTSIPLPSFIFPRPGNPQEEKKCNIVQTLSNPKCDHVEELLDLANLEGSSRSDSNLLDRLPG